MAENTLQFQWIVTIKENLEDLFQDVPDVFIAGDLLWYPVQGKPKIRQAPDVLAAQGRPKGHRGSYRQWEEANVPPQVVFEVLSPGNTPAEMARKLLFYQRYGVEEYYVFDPDRNTLTGYLRNGNGTLLQIPEMNGWVSPRLKIRFDTSGPELRIYRPDGQPFLTYPQMSRKRQEEAEARQLAEAARNLAEAARKQAEEAKKRAEEAKREAEQARKQAEDHARRLAERLRALGVNPDEV
jgi:Uma2 family endonuclease